MLILSFNLAVYFTSSLLLLIFYACTAFGWDSVNFLHRSSKSAVFCICDQNSPDNTPTFCHHWADLGQHQGCLFLTVVAQQVNWGCRRVWQGTQQGQLTPMWPMGYPKPKGTVLSNNSWVKKEEVEGTQAFRVKAFIFQHNCYTGWSPAFLEMAACCSMGSDKRILHTLLFAYAALLSLLNFVLAHNCLHFYPFDSLSHTSEREKVSG